MSPCCAIISRSVPGKGFPLGHDLHTSMSPISCVALVTFPTIGFRQDTERCEHATVSHPTLQSRDLLD